jgi:hypothetical protein
MPLVAQTLCSVDQLRERSLFDPDKKRVVSRIAHPTTFEAVWHASAPHLEADDE